MNVAVTISPRNYDAVLFDLDGVPIRRSPGRCSCTAAGAWASRTAARRAGFKGAMFPWQSGSDGQEETLALNRNPRSPHDEAVADGPQRGARPDTRVTA